MDFTNTTMINWGEFLNLLIRFSFNLIVTLLLVRFLYYQKTRRKDYLFTFLLIGTIVFLLCFLLESVKLQLGFALGLFAIFGIIRYRTTQIPIKEMTYLFLTIGIAVINALSSQNVSFIELGFTNFVILGITFGLERVWLLKHESSKLITYEKIELIKAGKRKELIEDLRERTDLPIHRIDIGKINFLRDTAQIIVYYYTDEISNVNTSEIDDDDD
ncbi:DUF4956 domain-containing protein [Carboxylicivirga linearis]|uniref:DUF4956 domain-containing protein n=1 Tax=Carboxylicivirga linearis TaxID=1628157 RepID=A0ABS5JYW1_9BACT|nr:DUF4956 domain-containing protein [Carboxylicivirga linearis]MBS2099506.1 DUF4956 domain-containing protein [Carboxylicivirga linearis]